MMIDDDEDDVIAL